MAVRGTDARHPERVTRHRAGRRVVSLLARNGEIFEGLGRRSGCSFPVRGRDETTEDARRSRMLTATGRGFESPRLHFLALRGLAELSRNWRKPSELRDSSASAAHPTFSPFPPVSCAFRCAWRCAQIASGPASRSTAGRHPPTRQKGRRTANAAIVQRFLQRSRYPLSAARIATIPIHMVIIGDMMLAGSVDNGPRTNISTRSNVTLKESNRGGISMYMPA